MAEGKKGGIQQCSIKAHSVGVDDRIDPRSEETLDIVSRGEHCTSSEFSRKKRTDDGCYYEKTEILI